MKAADGFALAEDRFRVLQMLLWLRVTCTDVYTFQETQRTQSIAGKAEALLKAFLFFFFLKTSLKTNDKNRPSEVCPLSKAKKQNKTNKKIFAYVKSKKQTKKKPNPRLQTFPQKEEASISK